MESIAEASDVGIGTLYRNFAARPELVEEVTLDMLQDVRQAAERAAAGLARVRTRLGRNSWTPWWD